jgi:DNA-binding transcriptional ArsR family regulator
MGAPALPKIQVDQQLFRLLKNPGQLEALVVLIERRASPSEIAEELGAKLNQVTYNVKELEKMGLVELVDTESRRGQIASIYRAVMRPVWSSEDWEKLNQEERERYAVWALQLFLRDIAFAWKSGSFQARKDSHTSRSPLRVDEEGWQRVNSILDQALADIHEVEVESADRAREGADGALVPIRVAMFCVEMPAGRSKTVT